MHIKHLLISGAACLAAAGIFASPAYAHHGGEFHGCQGRSSSYANSSYANSSYADICSFEDCSETGIHYHGETAYCGYDHEGGICDGSCLENGCGLNFSGDKETQNAGARMGHHGRSHCRR